VTHPAPLRRRPRREEATNDPHAGAVVGRCQRAERGAGGRAGRMSPAATFMNRHTGCAGGGLQRRRGKREGEGRQQRLGLWAPLQLVLQGLDGKRPPDEWWPKAIAFR
jgi:hypothetical protein